MKSIKKFAVVLGIIVPVSLMAAPAAHAIAHKCVQSGGNGGALPGVSDGACPGNDAANLFEVNVCVLEPSDGSPGDGPATSVSPLIVNASAGPVEAWADFSNPTGPQGELEVVAAGSDTGITSNQNPDC